MNHIDGFIDALSAFGLSPRESVRYTGGASNIVRYHVEGDKHSRKNGWYWLDSDNGISFGAFGTWRGNVSEKWCSKKKSEFTPVDKKTISNKEKQYKDEETIKQVSAAARANRLWEESLPAITHYYIEKKGINPPTIRITRGRLLIPITKNGQIVNLQIINRDGLKLFLKGGEIKGCYSIIPGLTNIIYICEGYATAVSVAEATGCMTIVAFNDSNLVPVAKVIRMEYKTSQIIIAADNDKMTEGNPGLTWGKKAAVAVGGVMMYPEHDNDFNDLHSLKGLEAVKDALTIPSSKQTQTMIAPDWRSFLIPGNVNKADEGYPFPYKEKSKMNVYLFMKNLHNIFAYNEFSDEIVMMKSPEWNYCPDFMPRRVNEEDFFRVTAHLERYGLSTGKDVVFDAVVAIAKENTINPPRDFFNTLVWDKVPRLDGWLKKYMGANDQPEKYLGLVGSKWLIAGVSRIFMPGCKFDSVLVLEGSQGVGKSTALRTLATFNGADYFIDSVGDIRNKDTIMTLQGKMIIEMPELATMRKSDNEEMKAFFSRQVDEYRPPYGRLTIRRPRYGIYAGTTNEVSDGYLTDTTGNRRYWPVRCGVVDNNALDRDKYHLWAEAVHRYKDGEKIWMEDEQVKISMIEQESRMQIDPWQDMIEGMINGLPSVTIDEIWEKLGIGAKDRTRQNRTRIKTVLQMLGWYESKRGSKRAWKKK